jgi:hypothetical protein
MKQSTCFHVHGFVLQVHPATYLIEVSKIDQPNADADALGDLPCWIFDSRYAIWLTLQGATLYERAIEGEKIRNHILSRSVFQSCV